MQQANVFNIERYATEDGHGIRTVVFVKGCKLRCKWCANPESQEYRSEVLLNVNTCIACGKCMDICPEKAIHNREGYGYITDAKVCTLCKTCVTGCYMDARKIMGTLYTAKELLNEILRDKQYYKMSGGGVTFSGGEPFYYDALITEIAKEMKRHGCNTLVETCGEVPLKNIKSASEFLEYIYFDFKHYHPDKHRELTGRDNIRILQNLNWLNGHYKGHLAVRYPYIPSCNDDEDAIRGFFTYIKPLKQVREIIFLPYHRLGLPKYQGLGRDYEMGERESLKKAQMQHLFVLAKEYGMDIKIQ